MCSYADIDFQRGLCGGLRRKAPIPKNQKIAVVVYIGGECYLFDIKFSSLSPENNFYLDNKKRMDSMNLRIVLMFIWELPP